MLMSNRSVEERLAAIESRYAKVELYKSWEKSLFRRLGISVVTYIVIALYLLAINNENPFLYALIPAVGYFLSTLVMKNLRDLWGRNR
jgi:hypothetical protein